MTNKTGILLLRDVGFASASYCTVCFAVTIALYLVVVMTGNADVRDSTGAPVEVIFSAHALFVSSLFAGLFTTFFCLGGLAGVWILATGSDRRGFHHVLGGALMGAIASGVFALGSSSGDDHLVLRAGSVAAISLMIALLVRVYTFRSRVESETDAAARRD